jgi:dihydrofolate reductase
MQRLSAFTMVSLDGFFAGADGDLSWAHGSDPEWSTFVQGNARGGGTLLFGRKTYELMTQYWPTPAAVQSEPVVAERMNNGAKVVFSKTLREASWSNTRLVRGDLAAETLRLKEENGKGLAILGSGSIVAQLSQDGLIDEYQIVVYPVVLGGGKRLFDGLAKRLSLRLTRTRAFSNGNVLLCYEPAA